jgi:hypothetical protein
LHPVWRLGRFILGDSMLGETMATSILTVARKDEGPK